MTRPKILLSEPLDGAATSWLGERAEIIASSPAEPLGSLDVEERHAIEALIVRGATSVDAALLDEMPSLRVLARAGVGVDNIDLGTAAARGVRVVHVPHALTETVAEHAITFALALRRVLVPMAEAARAGDWARRDSYSGDSIAGARVAVIGLGSIGRRVARLFSALGADVVTWNRSDIDVDVGTRTTDLARALEAADVVSLHVALTDQTDGMIGREELDWLAERATVVNTARAEIVDRAAMLEALKSGRVAAYGVDGFAPAPPDAGDELLRHTGVLVTPHVAALTSRAFMELSMATVRGVVGVLEGGEPGGAARFV